MAAEENPGQTKESSSRGSSGPVGGELLALSRRARGISVREIAKELHIDEPKVRALEENRFEVLGAPVFAKGHLRKYAELVGVPIDDLLADYYKMNRSAGAPPVVGPPRKTRREVSIGPWAGGFVVILVLAAAMWWFVQAPTPERLTVQPPTVAPVQPQPAEDTAAAADETAPPGDVGATTDIEQELPVTLEEPSPAPIDDAAMADIEQDLPVAFDEPAAEVPAEALVPAPASDDGDAVAGNRVQLSLTFSGDCWTEVTDAAGRRLYFDLGSEGRTVTLNGVEPLRVLLGNSANVSIRVNGLDYRIPAANRRGDTARLTLYAQ